MSETGGNNNPVLAALGAGAQTAGSQAQTNQLLQLLAQILVALQSGGPIIPSSHVQGTTTNDNAPAGFIGEYISANVNQAATTGLTSTISQDITSISLTAGDWDVEGIVGVWLAAGTTLGQWLGWISLVSATQPGQPNKGAMFNTFQTPGTSGQAPSLPTGRIRISLASSATVYLSTNATFTGSTAGVFGFIGARRAR